MAYFGLPLILFLVGIPLAAGLIFIPVFLLVRHFRKKKAAKKENDSADI